MNLSFNIKISDSNANIIILSAVAIFIAILIVAYILFIIYKKINKNKKVKETFLNTIKNAVDCNHEDFDLCEEGKLLYNNLEDKRTLFYEWSSETKNKREEADGDINEDSEVYKLFTKGYGTPAELSPSAATNKSNSIRRKYCYKNKYGGSTNCGVDCFPESELTGNDDDNKDNDSGKQQKYFCINKGNIIANFYDAHKQYNNAKKIHNDKIKQAEKERKADAEGKASQSKESFINALSNTNTLSKQVTIEDNIRPTESKKISYPLKSNTGSKIQLNNIFSDFISIIKF